MDLDFLRRVRTTSIITALVLFPFAAVYLGVSWGAGWLLGCAWSLINLAAIGFFVRELTTPDKRRRTHLIVIFMVKLPVLYGLGFVLLYIGWLPVTSLLAGFIWPLVVITLKMVGRMLLGLDKRKAPIESGSEFVKRDS